MSISRYVRKLNARWFVRALLAALFVFAPAAGAGAGGDRFSRRARRIRPVGSAPSLGRSMDSEPDAARLATLSHGALGLYRRVGLVLGFGRGFRLGHLSLRPLGVRSRARLDLDPRQGMGPGRGRLAGRR